jgi:hypothetical protein
MINFIRRLFGQSAKAPSETRPSWDPQQFVYVMIPGDIQPLVRGERFEDPLADALQLAGLGEVSGGGSQLDDPYPDGRPRVAFCGIDIDVVDRDRALGTIRHKLIELDAPEGTELHYTEGTTMLLDRLSNRAWDQRLPRSLKHPGFGV